MNFRTPIPKAPLALAVSLVLGLAGLAPAAEAPARAGRAAPAAPPTAVPAAQLELMPVQGNVYMVTGLGVNVAVQVSEEGALLVDTPPPALLDQVRELVAQKSKRSIRYVINTSAIPDHVSGDEAVQLAVTSPAALANMRRFGLAAGGLAGFGADGVQILAHENVLNRITNRSKPAIPGASVSAEYYLPTKDFFLNGESIVLTHTPNAITDGDSLVYFRRSDVLATGDLFTPGRFPTINLEEGGSINGLIKAVNKALEITVPAAFQERGTYVIPGHGRLCDEADLSEFREMITVVRDRVQAMINDKKTLQQVQAARPAFDYENTYGKNGGPAAQAFVETVYKSLTAPPKGAN
jgi:glyoxylase-like metal-dependent hydrolase (beta-lactamase superfamily II)